eukprot:gnl/Spiro4/10065_TR5339_c0_g1_i1.p1 gnl/Spiro4/10065_TR5339_c0_g1~~gnl/Spiro4/10065_TR5339_c0_g1_i1.p1  ORF type:complete len:257 (+),score=53.91 gnl/Spiro4/10065_TR5339_c0_g1_i1:50-820(+)
MAQPAHKQETLLKFDTPKLAGNRDKRSRSKQASTVSAAVGVPPPAARSLPPIEAAAKVLQPEDVLNDILPPREYLENGEWWVQCVSPVIATRVDVKKLQDRLDQLLKFRQARETGICPIREDLYSQCFDELIRQVTIQCAERGRLMHRVRDEMRMTINAYRTLYESSIAFGMRKALQAEQGKRELEERIQLLEKQNADYEKKLLEAQSKHDQIQKREDQLKTIAIQKHADEIAHYKKQNNMLKQQLLEYNQSVPQR